MCSAWAPCAVPHAVAQDAGSASCTGISGASGRAGGPCAPCARRMHAQGGARGSRSPRPLTSHAASASTVLPLKHVVVMLSMRLVHEVRTGSGRAAAPPAHGDARRRYGRERAPGPGWVVGPYGVPPAPWAGREGAPKGGRSAGLPRWRTPARKLRCAPAPCMAQTSRSSRRSGHGWGAPPKHAGPAARNELRRPPLRCAFSEDSVRDGGARVVLPRLLRPDGPLGVPLSLSV
jgi:hypothetical protein